ncbi:hypothetical protein KKC59_03645, partial [bacterium]|nr:hypothetical protein [bacterium]
MARSTKDEGRRTMNINKIQVVETQKKELLYPITYTKSPCDILIGTRTLRQRLEKVSDKSFLLVNSRLLLTFDIEKLIEKAKPGSVYFCKDEFVFACLSDNKQSDVNDKNKWKNAGYGIFEIEADIIKYPWDIIKLNTKAIINDFELFVNNNQSDKENCFISESARFYGNATIITEQGPVIIDDDVIIKAPTIIEGPAFIGKGSLIDGAKIRPGTSIGQYCKIAGEVEESVFESFSNKHHDGFIGHSYIGSWVNLGAMTTNSDLKNNYHSVKVWNCGANIDTGELKVGCFIGDFTTLGIGTLIPTGAVIDPYTNIFGGGMIPKFVSSFTWMDSSQNKVEEYNKETLIQTISTMMKRRGREFCQADRDVMDEVRGTKD